jgi:hypothetical protein
MFISGPVHTSYFKPSSKGCCALIPLAVVLRIHLLQEWFTLSDQSIAVMLIDTPCLRPIFLVSLSPIQVFMQLNTYSKQVTNAGLPPLAAAVPGDSARGGQTADSVGG